VKLWRVGFVAFAIVLFAGTHWPRLPINPESGLRVDIAAHLIAFTVWTFLFARCGFFDRRWNSPRNLGISAMGAVAYAGFDEFTQSYEIFGRVADVDDYVANLGGVAIGTLVAWAWGKLDLEKRILLKLNRGHQKPDAPDQRENT